jgi:hypothetical protein
MSSPNNDDTIHDSNDDVEDFVQSLNDNHLIKSVQLLEIQTIYMKLFFH